MTCTECEELSWAGELPPDEAAALAEHLEGCAHCRAEAAQTQRVLGMAKLPPLSPGERAQLASVASKTLAAWHGAERRRSGWRRITELAVAAALGGFIASAALLGREGPSFAQPPMTASRSVTADEEPWPLEGQWPNAEADLETVTYEVPWTEEAGNPEGETP